jgi:penicillin-binding protein 2
VSSVSRSIKICGVVLFGLVLGAGVDGRAATTTTGKTKHHSAGTAQVATKVKAHGSTSATGSKRATVKKTGATAHTTAAAQASIHRHVARPTLAVRRTRYHEHFSASSFADNLTLGDVVEGEDPVVRAAAIEALGNMNGTAIAIDPSTGRILAMVNQKLALSRGAEPCSTIKLTVALAALEEGIVTRDTPVNLGGHFHMTMTEALAHSNNLYFETMGRQLGFERVKHYANEFGLGELAGYHIQGEQLGTYADEELPAALGGVGRM